MSLCKDCVSGVRHEGTPEGTYEDINGIKTYVATPKTDYPKNKAIIYVTDVFGTELPNHLILADDFARNGFKVYIPDLFEGDPAPANALDPGERFDLGQWLAKHPPQPAGVRVRKVIEGLQAQGVTTYGGTGFCYGARIIFDLAFDNLLHVSVVNHPSFLQHKDLDIYVEKSKAPLLINSCEFDTMFPKPFADLADEKLANFAPGYHRTYSPGATHGFTVRCDLNNPTEKAGRETAFKSSVEWLIKYL